MRTQTITVNSTPGDATGAARVVAENLRATGLVVTIGEEYTQPIGHKAGLLSVDLTIEDASASGGPPATAAAPSAEVTTPPVNDGPPSEVRPSEQGAADLPFDSGIDLSQGPDSVDDDGNIADYRREKREKRERTRKAKV